MLLSHHTYGSPPHWEGRTCICRGSNSTRVSLDLTVAKQTCCTHDLGIWPRRVVFVSDSCKELRVLLPHRDQSAGNVPPNNMFGGPLPAVPNRTTAMFGELLQLPGTSPVNALSEMSSQLRFWGRVLGKRPERAFRDVSNKVRLAGRPKERTVPTNFLLDKYGSRKPAGNLANSDNVTILGDMFRTRSFSMLGGIPESWLVGKQHIQDLHDRTCHMGASTKLGISVNMPLLEIDGEMVCLTLPKFAPASRNAAVKALDAPS